MADKDFQRSEQRTVSRRKFFKSCATTAIARAQRAHNREQFCTKSPFDERAPPRTRSRMHRRRRGPPATDGLKLAKKAAGDAARQTLGRHGENSKLIPAARRSTCRGFTLETGVSNAVLAWGKRQFPPKKHEFAAISHGAPKSCWQFFDPPGRPSIIVARPGHPAHTRAVRADQSRPDLWQLGSSLAVNPLGPGHWRCGGDRHSPVDATLRLWS